MAQQDSSLEALRKNYKLGLFSNLNPPLTEVELYNNRMLISYRDEQGTQKFEHIANPLFSNRRMIVADFEVFQKNIKQVIPRIPRKWYQTHHIIAVNVKEDLLDGLTMIEHRMLQEAFMSAGKAMRVFVFYHDKAIDNKITKIP